MKLRYRGVQYDYVPTQIDLGDSYAEGKYRGLTVQFRQPVGSVPQPVHTLKYRGVPYTTGEGTVAETAAPIPVAVSTTAVSTTEAVPEAAPPVAVVQPSQPAPATIAPSIDAEMRLLAIKHHQNVRRREQSVLARFETEVGLTVEDAIHFWNHIQGKPHSEAWAVYDRSHVAMS
jgi:hypothetical protein